MGSGASTPRSLPDSLDKARVQELAGDAFKEELFDSLADSDGTISKATFLKYKTRSQLKNSALIFIKPHAVTEATQDMVRKTLAEKNIDIVQEGDILSEDIDAKRLIDKHYYAIASKATLLKPEMLPVPADKFEEKFGENWDEVLEAGKAYNAMDASRHLQLSAKELEVEWRKAEAVKFGGGFYCAKIDTVEGKEPIYVFNAFFMAMRSKFTEPGGKIHYYVVEWDPSSLCWEDFRAKVVGATDPSKAPPNSMRGAILCNWKDYGLESEPTIGDNGVHASASPFEGLAEKLNWMESSVMADALGAALVGEGIPEEIIEEWSRDPVVKQPGGQMAGVFDSLEDLDVAVCMDKLGKMYAANQ